MNLLFFSKDIFTVAKAEVKYISTILRDIHIYFTYNKRHIYGTDNIKKKGIFMCSKSTLHLLALNPNFNNSMGDESLVSFSRAWNLLIISTF